MVNINSILLHHKKKRVLITTDRRVYSVDNKVNIISNDFIDDNIVINSIFNVKGDLYFLVTKGKMRNYLYHIIFCWHRKEHECDCEKKCKEYCDYLCTQDYLEVREDEKYNTDGNIMDSVLSGKIVSSSILNTK